MQVDDLGPAGPVAYTFVYTVLELVIIPAIPLTMAAGALFGVAPGVVVVSLASTAAAALGFLITRYAARDKVCRVMLHGRLTLLGWRGAAGRLQCCNFTLVCLSFKWLPCVTVDLSCLLQHRCDVSL